MTHALKSEIWFITEEFLIIRYFNEKKEHFKIRYYSSKIEKPITKKEVLKISYPWGVSDG
jgi:hypothetical protein